jgi:peptidoglycan hydrolase CwlO-like protein
MDVEKTMKFIVRTLADLTVKQARTDRKIHGLQVLVKTGMRMLVKTQDSVKRTDQVVRGLADEQKRTKQALRELAEQMGELAVAQKRTEERFQQWLERGSNGGKRRG